MTMNDGMTRYNPGHGEDGYQHHRGHTSTNQVPPAGADHPGTSPTYQFASDQSRPEPVWLRSQQNQGAGPGETTEYDGPLAPPRSRTAPKRRSSRAQIAAIALVAGLVGGAAGAGITTGLTTSATPAAPVTRAEAASTRTVASADSVDWAQIAEEVRPSVVAIETQSAEGGSAGSGFVIAEDGYILTNHHVIAGATHIQVTTSDGQIIAAEVVGSDPSTDLAVLKLAEVPDSLTVARIGSSDSLTVGEPVVAVGNPLGLSQTVTTGIISALDRPVVTGGEGQSNTSVVTNAIQVDAAINPGNSGGPLFNAAGEVVGVNSSIAALSGSNQNQAGSIGLGFAIPIDLAARVANDIIADGTVEHAFVGVSTTSKVVDVEGRSQVGATIAEVVPGSPADQAGLVPGDSITKINDDRIVSNTSLTGFVRQFAPGEDVVLQVVRRDGTVEDITLTLGTLED